VKTTVVTLDAGNTLFTERLDRDEIYWRVLRESGADVPLDRVAKARHSVHETMPDSYEGHVRYTDGWFAEFASRVLRETGCAADPDRVFRDLADVFSRPESYLVFADAISALDDLTAMGVRLAVVSNWSPRLRDLLAGFDLSRYFEVIVISAEIGHAKPAPAIFEHALGLLDIEASRVTHVGDDPVNDLSGARRAGLQALLIDRDGQLPASPHVIRSLQEIQDRL
jgi:putative hydrolase of the HAD superfamily